MKEIYRKFNEKTINKVAKRIIKKPKGEYEIHIKNGVLACGGDIEYLENIIKEEIEYINYSTFDEVSQYNPRKFMKSMRTNNWTADGLKMLPGGLYEHAYIGKFLVRNIAKDERVDIESIYKQIGSVNNKYTEEQYNRAKKLLEKESNRPVDLIEDAQLVEYFPYVDKVYISSDTKQIVCCFHFPEILIPPEFVHIYPKSIYFNKEYCIKDLDVKKKQMKKIEQYNEKLEIPELKNVKAFIKWLNGPVTFTDVERYTQLHASLSPLSMQYRKEAFEKIKNDDLYKELDEFEVHMSYLLWDPYTDGRKYKHYKPENISHDYLNDEKYKEIYE